MKKRFFTASASILMLAACADGGSSPAPSGGSSNAAPVFTSGATASVVEDGSGVIYTAAATDADGDALTFSISGGADAALFSVTPAGAVSFTTAANFESPRDVGRDNIYDVTLSVSDGRASATRALAVTVTNGPEPYRLRGVATGLAAPLFLIGRPGASDVFVTERNGVIRLMNTSTGTVAATPFLDISASIGTAGEGGLIGFAPAPDYVSSGHIYVHVTNTAGDSEIRRYARSIGNPDVADAASMQLVLRVTQPASNHNGGWIGFGADDLLYIAFGDGGGGGDPFGNGQNLDTLLGSLLRINPSADDFPGDATRNYAIPAGNPFVGVAGEDEIFAYGLRNPYRSSVDRDTGDIYLADVGQGDIEEVDLVPSGVGGLNFGWPVREGTQTEQGADSASFTPPALEYGHGTGPRQGRSITGGYVYRGPISALDGRYFFADFISGNVWSVPVADITQGQTISSDDFILETDVLAPDVGSLSSIVSFGEDNEGNLYILTIGGSVFRVEPN